MKQIRPMARPMARTSVRVAALLGGLVILASIPLGGAAIAPADGGTTVRFGRDIRPILSDRCFKCHGPDSAARQAGLRLDERDNAIAERDGVTPIAPGDLDKSELWRRINEHDPDEVMPPPTARKKPLSADEKDLIRRWILDGAAYEPHWAFVPPARPAPPAVKAQTWCRNDIDRFILANLEREGVSPSPAADPPTLARRIYLDLTGLPPTPEEIDAFTADAGSETGHGAVGRLADRLMTQEPYRSRFAERMATPWLDQSRYADTNGIHTDAGKQMWLWRDWVLKAYRDNIPFDRFITEQLAGDLLPDTSVDQRIASGFNRNHVMTDEGGAIAEEYLVEYAAERASTTGSVFLGLTMGCARCHDHKFDPVTQADFYSMFAFFDSVEEPGLYSQLPDPQRAFEPFLIVPTPEQKERKAELERTVKELPAQAEAPSAEEDAQRTEFFARLPEQTGLAWAPASIASATSTGGATLTVQDDGCILASGKNPDKDEYEIVLRAPDAGPDLRLVALHALMDPSFPEGRVGRAPNGNAVLSGIVAEAVSIADPAQRTPIRFNWAWADVEQMNGDYRVVNAIKTDDNLGWAVAAHQQPGDRLALFLADQPFGFEGGAEIHIRLQFNSVYAQHTFGRVRLSVGRLAEPGLERLPLAQSGWYLVGPFLAGPEGYDKVFGPEEAATLDLKRNYGAGNQFWRFDPSLADERLNNDLPKGSSITFTGKRIYAPSPRKVEVSLGSDDGFVLLVNGKEVSRKKIERSLSADQDKATIELATGENSVVLKIVNTGGDGGMYWKSTPDPSWLRGDLAAALAPDSAKTEDRARRLQVAWKLAYSARYQRITAQLKEVQTQLTELDKAMPRTMVMKELDKPRETYVLMRGVYDKPDKERPVPRAVPRALGSLPQGVAADRLALARWLVSDQNPLVARVAVNKLWEQFFSSGIVRTPEDFGYQGEWPSHPALLDWLAVEFRESGWNVEHMIRLIVTSSTYGQSSRVRPDVALKDPENRWLSYFPRRRLSAEQIRDQALYVSGLLVEKFGGPSVKPYQPAGLWKEVAMPASNTREYEPGTGPDLWRRSLYTYWKRAAPPPSMMTFDAPTRESCTIRRIPTNTPLQALVLWNDEQYVEASRVLAARILAQPGDDAARISDLFRRCTGREPSAVEQADIAAALAQFKDRYRASPEDAKKLLMVGQAPAAQGIAPEDLAAWTVLANAMLNLDATVTKR